MCCPLGNNSARGWKAAQCKMPAAHIGSESLPTMLQNLGRKKADNNGHVCHEHLGSDRWIPILPMKAAVQRRVSHHHAGLTREGWASLG